MDIHKPKPWHGVREFLKEYVIIVIGVLTALGAEQLVETVHWAEKVERGKAHETTEMTSLYDTAYERIAIEPCLDRRLVQLSAALQAGDGRWTPLNPMTNPKLGEVAYFAPSRNWSEEFWKSLIADGTANHLSDDDELRYSRVYAQVATIRAANALEVEAMEDLSVLQVPTVLTRPERNELINRIGRLRQMNQRMSLMAQQITGNIDKAAKVDKPKARAWFEKNSYMPKACAALGLSLAPAPDLAPTPAVPSTEVDRNGVALPHPQGG